MLPLFFALVCLTTDYWIWHLASYADQTEAQTGSTVSPPEKWNSFSSRVNLFKKSFYCDLKANIKLPAGKRDKYAIRSVTSGANVCAQPCYILLSRKSNEPGSSLYRESRIDEIIIDCVLPCRGKFCS